MKRITAFSFGYWGWGNTTEQLIQAVDSVERLRGFKPPIFVDTRINRSVRAIGFDGNAFGDLVGSSRYHWMKRLGNRRIREGEGTGIKIDDPSAAEDLLDLAVEAAKNCRRLIFFCACIRPKAQGRVRCHRVRVATLLRLAAKRRGLTLDTVEWPGGKPIHFELSIDADLFRSVARGLWSIPIGHPRKLADWAGIPWGSTVTVISGNDSLHRLVGPVKWEKGQWILPILWQFPDPTTRLEAYKKDVLPVRRNMGLLTCRST